MLTNADRAIIENVGLKRILNKFIGFKTSDEKLLNLKTQAISFLKKISEQKKATVVGKEDPIERQAFFISEIFVNKFKQNFPGVVIERLEKRKWEAYIADLDHIGVGQGDTAHLAMQDLRNKVKNYKRK
jgi:hypothetical protein